MQQYVSLREIDKLSFGSCQGCYDPCCCFSLIPLILDDIEEVYQNFPILFGYMNDELRLFILLASQYNSCCRYFQNGLCVIYDSRPPGCRMYPFTPFYDDVLADLKCKALHENGNVVATKNELSNDFFHPRLEEFNKKLQRTADYLKEIDKDELEFVKEVVGIRLYRYSGTKDDAYIQKHKASLMHEVE